MSVDRRAGEAHYKTGGMEPIEFIEANKMGFSEGCIVKYAQRHRNKPFEEAVKDLYDIAIYAYLILKHQYDRGPLVDGRFVPTLKNAGQPAPAMPVSIGPWDQLPTTIDYANLYNEVYFRIPNPAAVTDRALVQAATAEIKALRKDLAKYEPISN
jgi:Protein of unknwon function (DUF3310)